MRRILSIAALSVLVFSSTAGAQRGTSSSAGSSGMGTAMELGLDGGVSFGTGGTNNSTLFDAPIKNVRVGFLVSPQWSVEPSLSLSRQSQGNQSNTQYAIGVGGLYHFSAVRAQNQIYVRPFVNFLGFRSTVQNPGTPATTTTTSTTLNELGAGVGVKMPWRDRLAWRLEAGMSHFSKPLDGSNNRIGLLVGVSYFTR
jgi:hypothetical protein